MQKIKIIQNFSNCKFMIYTPTSYTFQNNKNILIKLKDPVIEKKNYITYFSKSKKMSCNLEKIKASYLSFLFKKRYFVYLKKIRKYPII